VRPVLFIVGWCFFGLGAIGVVVPGLPTVPFMLAALWAFARSSQRFHDWLYHHRVFGPPLQQWREHGVIPTRAKVLAVVTMTISLVYMLCFTDMTHWAKVGIVAVMVFGGVFILRQPSRLPA
jgi:uncharacterized membrane protein YbaN (DUF454 family)